MKKNFIAEEAFTTNSKRNICAMKIVGDTANLTDIQIHSKLVLSRTLTLDVFMSTYSFATVTEYIELLHKSSKEKKKNLTWGNTGYM